MTGSGFTTQLPLDEAALRARIYGGELFHVGPNPPSLALVEDVQALLHEAFGPEDPRYAQARLPDSDFFGAIGKIRKTLFDDPHFHARAFDVIAAAGLDPEAVSFDPVRLRVVSSGGHRNPKAAPLYYPHRDTWFSISQSAIAWWIAMHDVPATETFVTWPDHFDRPVANDSAGFDCDRFSKDRRRLRVGWQDEDAGQTVHYSQATEPFEPGREVFLHAKRGDNVLFSAAHLHETLGHEAGYTRYSLDFRVVHLGDHAAGRGAPNADSACTGDATKSYVRR